MRGKDSSPYLLHLDVRITPAYAGKRLLEQLPPQLVQDHPRICGEKTASEEYEQGVERITPAYAGKRKNLLDGGNDSWDHPRICGEKLVWLRFLRPFRGSPPHMRGKVDAMPILALPIGITPAYAGKSVYQEFRRARLWDHPRICGEKKETTMNTYEITGSPPHMRGKESQHVVDGAVAGITPAYAGKRPACRGSAPSCVDHPRICGEKTKKIP